jgi:hypothetical protein
MYFSCQFHSILATQKLTIKVFPNREGGYDGLTHQATRPARPTRPKAVAWTAGVLGSLIQTLYALTKPCREPATFSQGQGSSFTAPFCRINPRTHQDPSHAQASRRGLDGAKWQDRVGGATSHFGCHALCQVMIE